VPRRPAPLDPASGPVERFAAELRALRDRLGSAAPSTAALAEAAGIPRSTLYAVLAGKRVPSEMVLTSLVEAYGGDVAEWLARRTRVLEELAPPRSTSVPRPPGRARSGGRVVLVCVRNGSSLDRALAAVAQLETDHRVQIVFTVDDEVGGAEARNLLRTLGAVVLPWHHAVSERFDLVIAAHASPRLAELKGALVVLPHSAPRKTVLDLHDRLSGASVGRNALIGLAHESQLDLLVSEQPQVVRHAAVVGDPVFDLLLANRSLRARYRGALDVRPRQRLVMVTSTWGEASLLGRRPELLSRLLVELPVDEYKVVAVLHPSVWSSYGRFQLRNWLRDAVDGGLRLVEPEHGWQSALIAADLVIGDHGSVTSYATALGIPTVTAVPPPPGLDRWWIEAPPAHLAPVEATSAVLGHLVEVVHDLARRSRDASVPTASAPSAGALREQLYRLVGLAPLPTRSRPHAFHVPVVHVEEPPSFLFVVKEREPGSTRIERYPCVRGVELPHGHFVIATDREVDPSVLDNADMIIMTARSAYADAASLAEELLATHPNAALAAAATAEADLVVRFRSRPPADVSVVRASDGFSPDPALVAAAVKLHLDRFPNAEGSAVQVGGDEFKITLGRTVSRSNWSASPDVAASTAPD